jgi:hypothetical protein
MSEGEQLLMQQLLTSVAVVAFVVVAVAFVVVAVVDL